MKTTTVVLLSALLLLPAGWAGGGAAGGSDAEWWVEGEVAPTPGAPQDPASGFEPGRPAETGSLPCAHATGSPAGEMSGASIDRVVEPQD